MTSLSATAKTRKSRRFGFQETRLLNHVLKLKMCFLWDEHLELSDLKKTELKK